LTLGRYAHAGLHDLAAAVGSLPDMLAPETQPEALAATGTENPLPLTPQSETGRKNLGLNLVPQPAISGDFLRQAETEKPVLPVDVNLEGNVISGDFTEGKEQRPLPDSNRGWRICNTTLD
jgi:hypothetical protein